MNRIAARLSLGLLATALVLAGSALLLARTYLAPIAVDHALQARVLEASKLPPEERERALLEIAGEYGVPISIVHADDAREPGAPRPTLTRQAAGFGAGAPLTHPKPFEADRLLVRTPSAELISVGPLRPSPWPLAAAILGAGAFVIIAGVLLARPLIRRLTGLQETAVRISRGELAARADTRGDDAISEYAAHFNQMAERNQAMLEGQRDLMRGVSHELRTPVARIRFALELAREAPPGPKREHHLEAIDADLGEIDELIQELLLVDRLSSGLMPAASEAFDALAIIRDELDRERTNRPHIQAALHSDLSELVAVGSERLFCRVVRNLVSNALKHARARVAISISLRDGMAAITFDDDGPGIPPAARDRILEPFVRLDESRSRELGGVGLGLTIVDRVLRAAGGSMRIDEAELGGARVTITWPCEREQAS